jgi:hypothetical protein
VSKKVDGTYQSGPCRVWIRVRDAASIAVQRERSELLEPMSPTQCAADEDRPVMRPDEHGYLLITAQESRCQMQR